MKIKKTGTLTKIIIIALLIYAVTHLVVLRSKIAAAQDTQRELEQIVAEKTVANEETQYAIEHSGDDSVIEDIARDKLGLVDQNEKVYIAD